MKSEDYDLARSVCDNVHFALANMSQSAPFLIVILDQEDDGQDDTIVSISCNNESEEEEMLAQAISTVAIGQGLSADAYTDMLHRVLARAVELGTPEIEREKN